MFQVEKINVNKTFINIIFSAKKDFDNLKLELRLRDTGRFLMYSYENCSEVDVHHHNNNHYEVNISLKELVKCFQIINPVKQLVYINVMDGNGNYYDLFINDNIKKQLKEIKEISLNKLAKMTLIGRGKNELAFKIQKNTLRNKIDYLNIDNKNKKIMLAVTSSIKNSEEELFIDNLYLKKRVFKDTLVYSESLELQRLSSNLFSLDFEQINNFTYDDIITVLDFVAEVKEDGISLEADLKRDEELKIEEININSDNKINPYWTLSNGLSIRVESLFKSIIINSINLNGYLLSLKLKKELSSTNNIKCFLFREQKIYNDLELVPFREINVVNKEENIYINLDIEEIFKNLDTNIRQAYQLCIEKNEERYILVTNNKFEDTIYVNNNIKIALISDDNTLKISIEPNTEKAVKLGIIGSCFTRLAFSSKDDFFNPDYKTYFSVEFSHFWPSIISLFSNPIDFKEENFPEVKGTDLVNLKREFEKSTFNELKNKNIEYVLIDFFVDAIHGVRKFKDRDAYVVQHGSMQRTSFLKDKLLKETEQFDYRNPSFWEKWKKSCDQFIMELEKLIDLDKVILIWGGLAKEYYDKNKLVKNFAGEKRFTNTQLNYFNNIWNKMNNYFLSKAPNAKLIDMRKYNYLSTMDHKDAFGPHHFESNYYKSLIGELSKIVTRS
ncbi:hypothetical protein G4D61_05300 [Bacillus ginsengihumi]|uniref:Uncharacterized protein n=1 Tax=Heyndrickxia ginsengihumi TaxID=363870 RepID=A0A6M0P3U5_9BACI|nr:DUF6270 domain-containing protein [Heyndrickxia ginsengihumi]NEY19384.1 hypothetical protein [Heyndrickxia ginsengihumi]